MSKVPARKPSSRPSPKKKTPTRSSGGTKRNTSARRTTATSRSSQASRPSRPTNTRDRVDIGPQETPSSRLPNVASWANAGGAQAGASNTVQALSQAQSNLTQGAQNAGQAQNGQQQPKNADQAQNSGQAQNGQQQPKNADQAQNGQQPNNADQAQNGEQQPKTGDPAQAGEQPKSGEQAQGSEGSAQVDPSKLPEGVSPEDALKTGKRISDLVAFGTHLPGLMKMGPEIEQNGFNADHIQKIKDAMPALEGVLTPENLKEFQNMNPDQIDNLLSPENMKILEAVSPDLAKKLNPEKIAELKDGIKSAQGALDKDKIGSTMSFMAPFVGSEKQEGVMPMLARMIDDPTKLGGADRALSLTDITPTVHGLLNTNTIGGEVSSRINQEAHKLASRRQDGTPRLPFVQRLGHRFINNNQGFVQRKGWEMVRSQGPGMARKAAAPYLSSQGSPMDGRQRRSFSEQEAQTLLNAGKQLQQVRGTQMSTGNEQNDRVQSAMTAATNIIDKSLRGDDGVISAQEARNVADAGKLLYRTMGMLYTGLGGEFQQ